MDYVIIYQIIIRPKILKTDEADQNKALLVKRNKTNKYFLHDRQTDILSDTLIQIQKMVQIKKKAFSFS